MTEGAIRAHRQGIVTACSVVANGREFDDAVARLRDVPSLEVGVHLTLVEERALTTGQPMPRDYVRFLFSRRMDVEPELRAQIEKVLAAGLRVTSICISCRACGGWWRGWRGSTASGTCAWSTIGEGGSGG